jgi:hypothetical protein
MRLHIPMSRSFAVVLLLGALLPWPVCAQAAADWAKNLPNPAITPKQRALLQEMGQDSRLSANVAAFFGLTQQRVLERTEETQVCLAAQYIVFQDIQRANPAPQAVAFAQASLKREDWCAPTVKAATNKTVREVLGYDGINTLFFVLAKDMETRLAALRPDSAAKK